MNWEGLDGTGDERGSALAGGAGGRRERGVHGRGGAAVLRRQVNCGQLGAVVPPHRQRFTPGKKGNPGRSCLDVHETFLLGLINERADITLAEMAERLEAAHGLRVQQSTLWYVLDRRGQTFKNVWPAPLASRLRQALFGRAQTYPA